MRSNRILANTGLLVGLLLFPHIALATRHLWDISEVFSNEDGSVQYIEIFTGTSFQDQLATHLIIVNADGIESAFPIPTNLPDRDTHERFVLFATPGFANLPGAITPDYTLPSAPFFNPTANSFIVSFGAPAGTTIDAVMFTGAELPLNGVDSLNADLSIGTNSPTNFAGQTGQLQPAGADPCVATPTTLCLNNNRFQVEVDWFTDGSTPAAPVDFSTGGMGRNTPVSDVWTGMWFFDPDNLDLLIHIFQGCGNNSNYWVFAAGLTDVEVTLTVTDTQTGQTRTYLNPLGTPFAPISDTAAFATCPKSFSPSSPDKTMQQEISGDQPKGSCVEDATTVCLHDGRFRVAVDTLGSASPAQRLADGTVGFPFTDPSFFDLFVSVIDASSTNGQYWVTYSMFNPSDFTLTVTDTLAGETRTYNHTASDPIFVQDQAAFDGDEVIVLDGTLSGSWFAQERDGEGFIFDIVNIGGTPTLVLYYFTFANNDSGTQAWVLGSAPIIGNKASVPVIIAAGAQFGADFNSADVDRSDWGHVKVTFLSCDRVRVESDSTLFPAVRYEAQRLTGSPTGVQGECQESANSGSNTIKGAPAQIDGGYSGSWFRPERDGEGFIFNIATIGGTNTLVVFYFTYEHNNSGRQAWMVGAAPITDNSADVPLFISSGAQFGDAFNPDDVVQTPWGNVVVTWQSCSEATVAVTSSFGDISFDINALTPPPIGATGECAM